MPLARTKSGTLTLTEDARGLLVNARLDSTDPDVLALVPKLRRGDVDSMSLAFRATSREWSKDRTERTITAMSLHRGDVSVVSQPANEFTSVSVRRRGAKKAVVGSYLATVKARRARLRRSDPTSPATSPFGKFWNIGSQNDGLAKVREVELGKAKGPKEAAIKAWIRQRARELGASAAIPKTDWGAARSRARRAVDGEPRYSPEEIQRLGEEDPPRAFKKAGGKFGWPIVDGKDVSNAISDYNRLKPSPRGVRAWIVKRARELRVEHRLPKGWGVVTAKPGPNASEPQLTGATESVGGQ